jgi:hypothetical protein
MTTFGDGVYQWGGSPVGAYGPIPFSGGRSWFVDGTNGLAGNSGKSPDQAFSTLTLALAAADEGDTIFVFPKTMLITSTDPLSYAETVNIDVPQVSIIGTSWGRVQAGLPQFKIGAGTTVMFNIRAPGVHIQNIGFNGASSTGGGIMLTDDGGSNYVAAGTSIVNCHFKNCKRHATNGGLGGAINWSSAGNAWQVLIKGNKFYKNLADVVLIGTTGSVPQDVVIEDNIFSGPAANVDVNIYTGGSGINGLYINRNVFPCWPAIGSGSNAMPLALTGSVGILSNNVFGATGKTAGAAADMLVPTTMLMANNYQEDGATQWART